MLVPLESRLDHWYNETDLDIHKLVKLGTRMNDQALDAVHKLFRNFAEYQADTAALTSIAVRGIVGISKSVELVEALANYDRTIGKPVDENDIEETKKEAAFAQKEIDRGFPFLYGQTSVAIWGHLEAYVEDLLVICLENDNSFMNVESIRKLRVTLSQYEQMGSLERKYYILDTLQRETQSKFKQGISQFEVVFNTFGLGGAVDDDLRKNLFELCNVRNVVVHRRGIADKRLVDSCAWLGLQVGDEVKITKEMFDAYSRSVAMYIAVTSKRVIIYFGGSTKAIDAFIKALSEFIDSTRNA